MVSMKDIANELNLSRCTVSNILNNKLDRYSYRPETVELVRSKAVEMGYVVNNLAQSLKTGSVRMIALVIPDISSTFYIEIIREIERLAYESNYGLIVCVTEEKVEKERRVLEMLKSRRVDGVIIACVSYTESVIDEDVYKVVAFDRIIKEAAFPTVTIDDYQVAYDLTSKVLKKGYQRPLFLGTTSWDYTVQCRLEGYKAALADSGLTFVPENVFYNWFNEMDAYENISRIRREKKISFDSIISTTNEIVFGVMKAMGDEFRDIGYGGFYSFNGSSFMGEKIVNVIPPGNMASLSFQMLLDRINKKPVENVVVPAKIL